MKNLPLLRAIALMLLSICTMHAKLMLRAYSQLDMTNTSKTQTTQAADGTPPGHTAGGE